VAILSTSRKRFLLALEREDQTAPHVKGNDQSVRARCHPRYQSVHALRRLEVGTSARKKEDNLLRREGSRSIETGATCQPGHERFRGRNGLELEEAACRNARVFDAAGKGGAHGSARAR